MLPGEVIANTCATLLLICVIAILFFLFGRPLWPEQHVQMVIIPPVDPITTTALKNPHPELPANFDVRRAPPRPVSD